MIVSKLAAFLVLASALASVDAQAQGLVQVTLSGEIDRTGGARVEFDVTVVNAATKGEPRTLSYSWFLAERTTAADVAVLLEKRLSGSGVHAVNTSEGQAARAVNCLFFDDVISIAMRLGQGLRASVTLSEDRPLSVRLLPPVDAKQDAELLTTISTWIPHEREHRRVELQTRLEAAWPIVRVAEGLATQATRAGWDSEVHGHETWMPGAGISGGTIDAVSFDLRTSGDWRIEIALVPRVQQR